MCDVRKGKNLPNTRKNTALYKGLQTSPARPSAKSSINIKDQYGEYVERLWQWTNEVHEKKPIPVALYSPQIPPY